MHVLRPGRRRRTPTRMRSADLGYHDVYDWGQCRARGEITEGGCRYVDGLTCEFYSSETDHVRTLEHCSQGLAEAGINRNLL